MSYKPWEVMTAKDYDIYKSNKYKSENSGDKDGKLNRENEALRSKYGITNDEYSYDDLRYQSAYGKNPYDTKASENLNIINSIKRKSNPYKNELYNLAENLKNFSYKAENDSAFKSYKDAMLREGKAAQNKIYSDLTAMTGGRNNSWATAAVAQSANATAKKISDIIPELSERAYDKLLQMYNVKKEQFDMEEEKKQQEIDNQYKLYENNKNSADEYRKTSQSEINNELKNIRTMQEISQADIELEYLTQQEYIKLILGQLDIEKAKANIEYRKALTAKAYSKL